jgi:hypothetical protein
MAIGNISKTVQEFRENALKRGGPQIASFYEVVLSSLAGTITCYPLNIIIPGRQYVYYEHDLWGPSRKIPYKRGYTQCHMSFMVYQDWAERSYIETWMNTIIKHQNVSGVGFSPSESNSQAFIDDPTNLASIENWLEQLKNTGPETLDNPDAAVGGVLANALGDVRNLFGGKGDAAFNLSNYEDYVNYASGIGRVVIRCINSQDKSKNNLEITLKEAYPAAISQMSIASDGSGYPTFNATFQFKDYVYLQG